MDASPHTQEPGTEALAADAVRRAQYRILRASITCGGTDFAAEPHQLRVSPEVYFVVVPARRCGMVLAGVAVFLGLAACKPAKSVAVSIPSARVTPGPSLSPVDTDPIPSPTMSGQSAARPTPTTKPTTKQPSPTTKPPATKSTHPSASATTAHPADATPPVIVGLVSAKPSYLLPQTCGSWAVALFSVKVTDATDARTKLKVTLSYHSQANDASGKFTMSYSAATGLFQASVPGTPTIPVGYVTFTVNASDAAGNRATPSAGPKLFSYSSCN